MSAAGGYELDIHGHNFLNHSLLACIIRFQHAQQTPPSLSSPLSSSSSSSSNVSFDLLPVKAEWLSSRHIRCRVPFAAVRISGASKQP